MARERVVGQRGLHQPSQAVEAEAQVGVDRSEPHAWVGRQADHAGALGACRTQRTLASSTEPRRRTRAPPMSISITPVGMAGGKDTASCFTGGVAFMALVETSTGNRTA